MYTTVQSKHCATQVGTVSTTGKMFFIHNYVNITPYRMIYKNILTYKRRFNKVNLAMETIENYV